MIGKQYTIKDVRLQDTK